MSINECFYISCICFLSCVIVIIKYDYNELPLFVTNIVIMAAGASAGIMIILAIIKVLEWLKL